MAEDDLVNQYVFLSSLLCILLCIGLIISWIAVAVVIALYNLFRFIVNKVKKFNILWEGPPLVSRFSRGGGSMVSSHI